MPDAGVLLFCAAAVFGAALARGFFGFGFSALCVATMARALPPTVVVPLVFMMEILASVWMLPGARRDIDFKWMRPVALGLLAGTPLGVWALAELPPAVARAGAYALIAGLAAVVWRLGRAGPAGWRPDLPAWAAGIFIGAINGLAALAGLAAAVFLLSSRRDAATIRASLVALFFISDLYAVLWGGGFGLVEASHFKMLALFAVPLAVGLTLGGMLFRRLGGGQYREWALGLILSVALLGLGREVVGAATGE